MRFSNGDGNIAYSVTPDWIHRRQSEPVSPRRRSAASKPGQEPKLLEQPDFERLLGRQGCQTFRTSGRSSDESTMCKKCTRLSSYLDKSGGVRT
jgi:hypothetical protein